jgi:hypothetical protein
MGLRQIIAGLTAGMILCAHVLAATQDSVSDADSMRADSDTGTDPATPVEIPEELLESRVLEEITVTVGPDGRTAYEMEMDRLAEYMKEASRDRQLREREAQEVAWRQADPDLENPESRIKWGYSAQAEQRMRRENDFLYDLSTDQVKPASVFRAEF